MSGSVPTVVSSARVRRIPRMRLICVSMPLIRAWTISRRQHVTQHDVLWPNCVTCCIPGVLESTSACLNAKKFYPGFMQRPDSSCEKLSIHYSHHTKPIFLCTAIQSLMPAKSINLGNFSVRGALYMMIEVLPENFVHLCRSDVSRLQFVNHEIYSLVKAY